MAHFVRPLALADSLDTCQYDVHFYSPARFFGHLKGKPFTIGELRTMPGERFLENTSKGAPIFPADVIRDYIRQDRELISSIGPDLVIGDMRLSLPVSARLEGAVSAVMINAYWSPYTRRRSILPALPLTRIVPPRLLGPVYKLAEPLAYAVHVGEMNRVRKEFGIPALPADLRVMYTEGSYVLYPDVPEFVPASNLPAHHRYVGICQWTPATSRPDWWDSMLADPKPKVFVSLGSSGPLRALPVGLGQHPGGSRPKIAQEHPGDRVGHFPSSVGHGRGRFVGGMRNIMTIQGQDLTALQLGKGGKAIDRRRNGP